MSLDQIASIPPEALDLLGMGFCLVDGAGTVRRWSQKLRRSGIAGPETEGLALEEVLKPRLKACWMWGKISCAMDRVRTEQQPVILRSIEMNGRQAYHLCVSPAGSDGALSIVFADVTKSVRIREQYERILDSSPDGIFVVDSERRIRLYNKACAEITGRDAADILNRGCECAEVIHCHTEGGESLAFGLCPAKSIFRGDMEHQREEMLLTNAHGEDRWIETTYSPVQGEDGNVEYVVGILRDVHERKLLEERLHQTEKLASLGQLIAGIAHEIKNPLAIILSSLDVMDNPSRPAEQRQEASLFVREEVRRIEDRLRSFLAFARPRPLHPRHILISGILAKRVAALEPLFPGIQLKLETASPEPLVMADAERLEQVVTNLVMNAADAMDGRGTITLRSKSHGDTAILEIEDEGPGVPADQIARVFDPFFTTKAEGTGLGLSISYQIVLAHKGTISVSRGKSGIGACFTVRLPMTNRFDPGILRAAAQEKSGV